MRENRAGETPYVDTGSDGVTLCGEKEMQNHRMYGTYEIYDTDDEFQMTVAIKKEADSENIDKDARKIDNMVRFPWRENPISQGTGRALISRNNASIDLRTPTRDADPCLKKRRLRAHWEHIEGVGLQWTWMEEPERELDAAPEAKSEANSKTDSKADDHAAAEPDSDATAK